jgi:hypothetical protein
MLKTWIGFTVGLALTGTALADDQNQAGPVESNTNAGGLTREGNVIDRTGTDTTNPSNATAPTNEQVDTDDNTSTATSFDSSSPDLVVIPTDVPTDARANDYDRVGIAISAGAGTSGFTSDSLRGAADVGGDWDVRATFGTRSLLAVEGSYIGSAQPISALGVDDSAMLVGNGVQGALRLNGTINAPVQPFVFAGAAWRRYDLTNTNVNTSDISGSDDVLEIPVGVGLSARWSGLLFDARGEFRMATNEDLLPDLNTDVTNDSFASMHRWGVNANVGYEF